ncbi:MAG: rhodanese-like domain-containing protein [Methylotenera sp.]|nr:rhodanese-like domain-containing protein [Methylotenera sp.]
MNTYSETSASDLITMLSDREVLLVDVRNIDEVVRGMIANAVHVPLAMLPTKFASLPKATTTVFYCHSGVRSAHAAAYAAELGSKDVYNLTGGILAWGRAGLPFVDYKAA